MLGYAVHRFKDPFAAWFLQQRAWLPAEWANPSWSSCGATTRSSRAIPPPPPRASCRASGCSAASATWSCATAGDPTPPGSSSPAVRTSRSTIISTRTSSIYHKGYLAIDAGADYTDTESPHYLNYYRRTVAHNTMLVYQPGETFFWGENKGTAANDGGQRMDSSRFWNTVRSLEDWRRTRDLWDRGRIAPVAPEPDLPLRPRRRDRRLPSEQGRALRPRARAAARAVLLVVLDRVRSTDPSYRKAWLLHGVSEPQVEASAAGASVGQGGTAYGDASVVTFEDGQGRLRVHSVLPLERDVVVRGGPGLEFWTPGDE